MTHFTPIRVGSLHPPLRRRRGSAYVLVLGMGMLLSVMGLSLILTTRVQGLRDARTVQAEQAELLAQAAVERACSVLAGSPLWRTTYLPGQETTPLVVGAGTISFWLVDELDGNLGNNTSDPVRIYGVGRCGKVTRVYSLQLAANKPLTALQVLAAAGGTVSISTPKFTGSGTLTSNNNIATSGNGSLDALNLEACGTITLVGTTGSGGRKQYMKPRTLPDPQTAFDYYINNGTHIPISAVTSEGTIKKVSAKLFSPASNPFGATTNSQGIYVIDCLGQTISLVDIRVVGTLVLLNTGIGSLLESGTRFDPVVTNHPVLLVKGNIDLKINSTSIVDKSSIPINYNPPFTPYEGVEDTTYTTVIPSAINGLVYVSGDMNLVSPVPLTGCLVVGGLLATSSEFKLAHNPAFYSNPPPGFVDPTPYPVAGSWRWEQAP